MGRSKYFELFWLYFTKGVKTAKKIRTTNETLLIISSPKKTRTPHSSLPKHSSLPTKPTAMFSKFASHIFSKQAGWSSRFPHNPTNFFNRAANSQQFSSSKVVSYNLRNSSSSGSYELTVAQRAAQNPGKATIGILSLLGVGTVVAYALNNRDEHAKQDGMSGTVRDRVSATYSYLAGSLGITAMSAMAAFRSIPLQTLMIRHPILSAVGTLAGSLGLSMATQSIPYENTLAKHLAWAGFGSFVGLSISPLGMLGGPLVMRAAAATGLVVGSLSVVAATDPSQAFLAIHGPLTVGLGVLIAASFGSMFYPSTLLTNAVLYGGAGLFGLFTLHDTQKITFNARSQRYYDPINNQIGIYLDSVNLFVKIAQIMSLNKSSK